ncbi:tripartite ATP-independent transporter DctM subunit [Tamaricihabitans halophyticus]|uniref:Tripartite ATP-independent transporter DctM subunit n=1 Tax=Tamaricihabitans halophyticus TaxID=1262583 RepID=A0A4R2QF86_9PSEU|nr:TRAP transporter large permease [Tamaricihabitans halophyticus]TCP47339.1 tripartite ATP-independent transporter DctM subunit [Tamaricihabitans halophyticus]
MTLTLLLLAIVLLLLVRVPVAAALLLPCFGYILLADGITMGIALQKVASLLNSFALLAVPLFILVGFIANAAGMADRMVHALHAVFGGVRGSLGYVNVAGSLMFSWMSGSSTADAAAMGSVMVPSMRKNGYPAGFAAGLTGAASMIGPVMPPSVGAVVYAVLSGSSVGGVLLAGVLPAVVLAAGLCLYVFLYTRKRPELVTEPLPRGQRLPAVAGALPVLAAPVILLGGILGGVFTPTEAAGVAALYLILLSVGARWLSWRGLYQALVGTASTTGRVMFIAAAGGLFSYVLVREGAPAQAAEAILAITDSQVIFLLLMNLLLLVIGMVLEPASALLVTVPVILPIALEFGVDPLQLGVIMVLNLTIGLLTPPVGLVLYVLTSVGQLSFRDVVRGTSPLLIPLIFVLLTITYIPELSTIIPELAGL